MTVADWEGSQTRRVEQGLWSWGLKTGPTATQPPPELQDGGREGPLEDKAI